MQAANFGIKVVVTDSTMKTVTVGRNNNLHLLARNNGTTEAVLQKLNPSVNAYNLKPGMVLKYQKAGPVTVIISWKSIDANSVYGLYNRNPQFAQRYPEELNFAYDLIKRNRFLQ